MPANWRMRVVLRAAFFCLPVTFLQGQDTVRVETVRINGRKAGLAFTGKKTERVDSAFRGLFRFNSLAEALSYHSAAGVRTYGPGGISMVTLRGASAEQTAVLWNGMNLQNSMLGLTDLGMVPASLFESVALEYGSSSAMWGSGAVGGSLHLDNAARFGRVFGASAGTSYTSSKQLGTMAVVRAGGTRVANVTRVYSTHSQNQFRFYHTGNRREQVMERAAWLTRGVMNDLRIRAGDRHLFSLAAWMSGSGRQLPGYDPAMPSKQYQDDASLRLQGGWTYAHRRMRVQARGAWFREQVIYTDSLADIFNHNLTNTLMADLEQFLDWGKNHRLHAGLSVLDATGNTENYAQAGNFRRFSILAGNRFGFLNGRLATVVNGRAELVATGELPVTGNAAAEYHLFRWLSLSAGAATAYRQPTLNELYWLPGGNRSLRPERSRGVDGTLKLTGPWENPRTAVTLAAFSRNVSDWIMWSPGAGGLPTPLNIQEVWSRGAETTWELEGRFGNWTAGGRVATSYVFSTVVRSYHTNNSSTGKQLIYTPLYQANGHLHAGYRNTRLFLLAQYAGYRYTTTDNSSWLAPYSLWSLRATHDFTGDRLSFTGFAACNNLLNRAYVVMDGRWMPLRNFELGITIHFNHKNQS